MASMQPLYLVHSAPVEFYAYQDLCAQEWLAIDSPRATKELGRQEQYVALQDPTVPAAQAEPLPMSACPSSSVPSLIARNHENEAASTPEITAVNMSFPPSLPIASTEQKSSSTRNASAQSMIIATAATTSSQQPPLLPGPSKDQVTPQCRW